MLYYNRLVNRIKNHYCLLQYIKTRTLLVILVPMIFTSCGKQNIIRPYTSKVKSDSAKNTSEQNTKDQNPIDRSQEPLENQINQNTARNLVITMSGKKTDRGLRKMNGYQSSVGGPEMIVADFYSLKSPELEICVGQNEIDQDMVVCHLTKTLKKYDITFLKNKSFPYQFRTDVSIADYGGEESCYELAVVEKGYNTSSLCATSIYLGISLTHGGTLSSEKETRKWVDSDGSHHEYLVDPFSATIEIPSSNPLHFK